MEIHSENQEPTGSTYKCGFGFYPLFCFFDGTGDILSSMVRPGHAAANKAEDHLQQLDSAVAGMP